MPQGPAPDAALGPIVKHLREARGLTQEQLAYEAKITTGTLSKIETGQASPAWATIVQIAEALEVGMGDIGTAADAAR